MHHSCTSTAKQSAQSSDTEGRQQGGETVFVVEDEASILMLVDAILGSAGYNVISASSGGEALEVWEKNKDDVDLLLSDMMMPDGINGTELCERFRREKPDLKILFSSGNLGDLEADPESRKGFRFLQKPYMPKALMEAVRDCLDE